MRRKIGPLLLLVASFGIGCALGISGSPKKTPPAGLIATPANYYSTARARSLAIKYKENVDRLAERIVRHSNTSQLQFANNISSVGGIGFFTHSATKTTDERYLEVVLSTPETFETKGEYSEKVRRLFSRFGHDLLAILAGDTQIFQDPELSGYGLNLAWRNVVAETPTNRITAARAIIYFNKERVGKFLRKELGQNELLEDAVIFAVEEDGPLSLVSYQPREIKQDFRPAIREDNLAAVAAESKSSSAPATKDAKQAEAKMMAAKKEAAFAAETKTPPTTAKPNVSAQPEANVVPSTEKKNTAAVFQASESKKGTVDKPEKASSRIPIASAEARPPTALLPQPASAAPPIVELQGGVIVQLDKHDANIAAHAAAPVVNALQEEKPIPDALAETHPVEPISTQQVESKPPKESAKAAPSIILNKDGNVAAKTEVADEIKGQEIALLPAVGLQPEEPAPEGKTLSGGPDTAKSKDSPPVAGSTAPIKLTPSEAAEPLKLAETLVPPAAKTPELTRPLGAEITALPSSPPTATKSAVADARESPVKEAPSATKVSPVTPAAAVIAKPALTEPAAKALAARPTKAPEAGRPSATELRPESEKTPAVEVARKTEPRAADHILKKSPQPVVVQQIEAPVSQPAMLPPSGSTASRQARSSTERMSDSAIAPSDQTPVPSLGVVKPEPASVTKTPSKVAATAPLKDGANDEPERLALLKIPAESAAGKAPMARPALKALEGFVIQIAFTDKEKAQTWAEKMQQRGYAVSVTEAGTAGSLRVRLGNFAMRDEAERQLRNFKQEGMNGIIINLPYAFQPEARSSMP
jgi:DedD protein